MDIVSLSFSCGIFPTTQVVSRCNRELNQYIVNFQGVEFDKIFATSGGAISNKRYIVEFHDVKFMCFPITHISSDVVVNETVYNIEVENSNSYIVNNQIVHNCQYSGRKISPEEGNIDHVVARSHGGKNTWDNMVWCDKTINLAKGDKTVASAGLKLIRTPEEPPALPISSYIKECNHGSWEPFLLK